MSSGCLASRRGVVLLALGGVDGEVGAAAARAPVVDDDGGASWKVSPSRCCLLTLGGVLCGDGSLANPFNVLFLAFCSYFDLARGELVLGNRAGVATFAPACLVASSVFAASEFRDFTASDGLSQSVPVFRDEERAKATPWYGRGDWHGSKSLRTSPPRSIQFTSQR